MLEPAVHACVLMCDPCCCPGPVHSIPVDPQQLLVAQQQQQQQQQHLVQQLLAASAAVTTDQVPVLPFAAPLEPHHQLHAQHPQEQAQLLYNNLQHTVPAAASPEGADVDMANAEALVPPLVIHNPKEPVSSLWEWLPRAMLGRGRCRQRWSRAAGVARVSLL